MDVGPVQGEGFAPPHAGAEDDLEPDRIADADRRIAELSAFTAHLVAVQQELSGPALSGTCAPGCGCLATR
ncbi:hypothetical protein GCM10009760_63860 [Kitasatospora kazusensis]|uniref:Uncharacterized protein n=1 Tax=Kitasatospora kazusensis TaxID=407974 RepID=A0ABP4KHL6_9ACTN